MSWSSSRSSRDNWERLVQAVLKKELIWQLCHQDSITTIASDFSQGILSNSLRPDSSSQLPLTDDSVVEDRKHASGTITQKLFSASVWRRKPKDYYLGQGLAPIPEANFRNFSLRELLAATGNFSEKHVLGRGGHGTVYKGLLADGTRVAVKRLKQQVIGIELEMASHVSHRNVIALCGFCITPKEQLLVYPIMENQSVASCLRERPKTQSPLKWPLRKQIALRAARGLSYLHHDCMRRIIHRDVKAANILLDINFDAIIADFTLAKFVDCYDDDGVKGTIGHIAPEYFITSKCSVKSDVYGYGQFLLELITGQKIPLLCQLANYDNMMIHDWVYELCKDKNMEAIVDPDLERNFIEDEVQKLLQIALMCTWHDPDERPMMLEVVRMLEDGAGDGVAERWEEVLKNKMWEVFLENEMWREQKLLNNESLKLLHLNSSSQLPLTDDSVDEGEKMSWSSSRSSRDNWERLVQAVLKKELIWQLCHQDSITTIASDFSQGILSNSLRPDSSSQLPLTDDSVVEDRKHASGTITQKLFSASVWRRKPKDYYLGQGLAPIPEANFRNFSLRELLAATGNFSEKHVLGRGGHGTVYKGLLADGTRVAVKRLKQQVIGIELEMASHVSHRNVIALCGFCITPKEQLLVYPIMENQSVASCLRERLKTQSPLEWPLRKQIALGAARGLSYLHHDCMRRIIHRDVKAANILLDINFDAIIADFTLAKFVDCYDYDGVKGTIDHIAPEYLTTGKCSVKSDVYGYGQFLLELITGQKIHLLRQLANNDNMMIHDWVNILWKDKNMVDPDLEGNFIEDEVQKLLLIALICTRHDPGERPMMFEVVRMLEDRAGDGVAERWEEFLINKSREKLIPHDNVEWIVCWSDDGVPDELSGPR